MKNIDNDLDFYNAIKDRVEETKEGDFLLCISMINKGEGGQSLHAAMEGDFEFANLLCIKNLDNLNEAGQDGLLLDLISIKASIIETVICLVAEDEKLEEGFMINLNEMKEDLKNS